MLDAFGIEADGRTSEQIEIIHVAQRLDVHLAVHDFGHGGQNLEGDSGRLAHVGNTAHLLARSFGHGNEYFVYRQPLHHGVHGLDLADHWFAVDGASPLARIVVKKADQIVLGRIGSHFPTDFFRRTARSYYKNVFPVASRCQQ